ncbi:MAG: methyltransferase domain-containing protein [Anaerolineales bacterium]
MNVQNDKKEILRGVFSRAAEGYGKIGFFQVFGKHLVEVAAIKTGEKVLDVACGRGAVLFPAAEDVGPVGQVIAIDLSDGMVQETTIEVERRGIKNVRVQQMDAENLQFPDRTFDVVLCGFALQFFPHLERGLAEFNRVLKPGGRVAATTWSEFEDPRWNWFEDLIDHYGARVSLGTNKLDTPVKIEPWFSNAGFSEIQINSWKFDAVYPDAQHYWNMRSSISCRAGFERLDRATLEKFKSETFDQLNAMKEPDGFHELLEALFTTATKSK